MKRGKPAGKPRGKKPGQENPLRDGRCIGISSLGVQYTFCDLDTETVHLTPPAHVEKHTKKHLTDRTKCARARSPIQVVTAPDAF